MVKQLRLAITLALLAVAVVFLLASCGGQTTTTTAAPTTQPGETTTTEPAAADTLTIAVSADPGSLDQDFVAFDLVALALHKNIYPYMVDYGVTTVEGAEIHDTTNVIPVFAESLETIDDGKTWILKIREGITFPSGNELTAEDVKWSKDRAFAAQANVAGVYRVIGLNEPEQIEVIDKYTVQFTQDAPSALTELIQVIGLYVFDSEEMKKHATEADPWAQEWATLNATSGGAFNVVSWQRGSELVLEANGQYPLGKPYFDTVRMNIVPAPATRRLMLERGDVDIAFDLTRKDLEDLKGNPDLKVISVPSSQMTQIFLDVTTPPLDNNIVRQAIAYAVPYEQIVSVVYGGDARLVKSPVPLDMPGHSPQGHPYEYDLDKAKELLEQAGYGDGFPTSLAIETDNEEQERIAILLQSELRKVGIDLEIETLDPATFVDRRAKKTIPMQIGSAALWINDVQYMLEIEWTTGAFLNYANYSNPRVDEIAAELRVTIDRDARMALAREVQEEIFANDVPTIPLCQPNFNLAMRQDIEGWVQPVDLLFRLEYLRRG
jgi:peptide/nickel transport system substrate-binding protein